MTKIYDRLLAINLEISAGVVPDPSYINRKIGECHIYLGEVERFFINVSKEISVRQRALNNSKAMYESKKDELLTTGEGIRSLPNITEKVAKANSLLKEVLKEIQDYDNELLDLNNLLKAINHKHRNLTRANGDIKSLIKMVEAQIRLGTPTDVVAKSFLEEMRKGIDGEDSFKDSSTESEENTIIDPTVPLNIQDLLVGNEGSAEESIQEETDEEEQANLTIEEDTVNNLSEDIMREAEESLRNESITVDLGSVLEPVEIGGEKAKSVDRIPDVAPKGEPLKETPTKNPDVKIDGQIDLDDFLKQYS